MPQNTYKIDKFYGINVGRKKIPILQFFEHCSKTLVENVRHLRGHFLGNYEFCNFFTMGLNPPPFEQ